MAATSKSYLETSTGWQVYEQRVGLKGRSRGYYYARAWVCLLVCGPSAPVGVLFTPIFGAAEAAKDAQSLGPNCVRISLYNSQPDFTLLFTTDARAYRAPRDWAYITFSSYIDPIVHFFLLLMFFPLSLSLSRLAFFFILGHFLYTNLFFSRFFARAFSPRPASLIYHLLHSFPLCSRREK